jgi:peptidoglycan-N-acetylglucosamine deacetylase
VTRLGALSVDLDASRHYRAIHGEPLPERVAARASFGPSFLPIAVTRAVQFAREHDLPLTFFVVTEDLGERALVESLQRAQAAGHALESHSRTHPYDLVSLSESRVAEEIGGSFDDLERVFGVRPSGFRAPGFTLSPRLYDALERAEARFDASLLPSPPYAAAKLGALALHVARGRRSASHPFAGAQLLGPRDPHRPGRAPGSRGARAFVELPMAVTRRSRLPLAAPLFATALSGLLLRGTDDLELLSVGLHALDFLEPSEAHGVPPFEPALRAPLAKRAAGLATLVHESARTWVTLAAAAAALGPSL